MLDDILNVFESVSEGAVGVAVSGGGDSVALLHLTARVAGRVGRQVHAVTVDHGLRAEAADEARQVGDLCQILGVGHDILEWPGPHDVPGNLQARAREARYDLLARWATDRGIGTVLLGHTADDQAETFLMRLGRRAGVDGLALMDAVFARGAVTFRRPLRDVSRADLRAYLIRNHVAWADDPSNDDCRFERVRARRALRVLDGLGIGADQLVAVSRHMTSAQEALDTQTIGAAEAVAQQDRGDLIFDRTQFLRLPMETRRRLLLAALRWIGGAVYPQRAASIGELDGAVSSRMRMALGGCLLCPEGDAAFRIAREWKAVEGARASTDALWDMGRWCLTGPGIDEACIGALGEDGIRDCREWRDTGLPRRSVLASPSVWQGDRLIAAPLAGLANGWRAELAPGRDNFVQSIRSH